MEELITELSETEVVEVNGGFLDPISDLLYSVGKAYGKMIKENWENYCDACLRGDYPD